MRTWVFYLSVYGRLFKAVVEKILHEKSTAYLTCSNAKKKALMEKCKWRGRLYMQGMFRWPSGTSLKINLDPLVDPDTDEFANLDNWSVIPVKNYHQHKHENCYVEGIKHYNSQNGKSLPRYTLVQFWKAPQNRDIFAAKLVSVSFPIGSDTRSKLYLDISRESCGKPT